jgi:ubiquinone/menaquinone biosynthesis C-methylase UbiE
MKYVHGYSKREAQRLDEQALILEDLLHNGTHFPDGSYVLEAGCGIGAQTRILARRNPGAEFLSVDISEDSLEKAKELTKNVNISNVTFRQSNLNKLLDADNTFDHVFICFVLEHLDNPAVVLKELMRVLKPGGTITFIEGDHGSCFWQPVTPESKKAWNSLIVAQRNLGHDPLIGRRLYPLLSTTKLKLGYVEPRFVYADHLNPKLLDNVVNKIIVPMVKASKDIVLSEKIITATDWDKGIADLSVVGKMEDGSFFYTWFKAMGVKTEI